MSEIDLNTLSCHLAYLRALAFWHEIDPTKFQFQITNDNVQMPADVEFTNFRAENKLHYQNEIEIIQQRNERCNVA